MIANTYVVKPFGISEVKVIALKGEPGSPTQEQVNTAVEEYMDDHPEAQIPDGAVTTEKLASNTVTPYADNLVSSSYVSDSEPYLFRKTFAGVREDDEIVGGSVVWNQLLKLMPTTTISGVTFTVSDMTIVFSGVASADISQNINAVGVGCIKNHIYYIGGIDGGSSDTYVLNNNYYGVRFRKTSLFKPTGNVSSANYSIIIKSGTDMNGVKITPHIIDLTLMFGSAIADYIYSLETTTAGAGVALAKAWAGIKGYVPYDPGTIKSVTGLTAHKMTGFNQWDEEWELGGIANADGAKYTDNARIRSKNYIPVFPSTTYYFKMPSAYMQFKLVFYDAEKTFISYTAKKNETFVTPANCHYMMIAENATDYGTTYNNDICVNLSDPQRNGQYEPYKTHSYALDSSLTLRGLPKLDGDSIYYDGDIYKADGTVNRKYGVVDLGTLAWTKVKASATNIVYFQSTALSGVIKKPTLAGNVANILSTHFFPVAWSSATTDTGAMAVSPSGQISCQWHPFDEYTAEQFKTAMSGVYLVYELATPTTETAEPYTALQTIYDGGTEEYVTDSIPVGHNTKYMRDLKKLLEGIPDAPTANGTYVLKATVSSSGVTYSWVEG